MYYLIMLWPVNNRITSGLANSTSTKLKCIYNDPPRHRPI